MEHDINPHKAIDYILANAKNFAKSKAQRIYLEEYRKSLKAILMKQSGEAAIGAQERDAYAHSEYQKLLAGLREAVENEETLRWQLVAAQARIEVWRSQESTNRLQDRAVNVSQ
jgi:hypothetical protein